MCEWTEEGNRNGAWRARYALAVLAGGIHAVAVVAFGALLGWLAGGQRLVGALVGGVLSFGPAVVYARSLARAGPYASSVRGAALCLLDATWGAMNTWAGALFTSALLARGNPVDCDRSRGSGALFLYEQAIPGYATTIGIVTAGCVPRLERHERVHVLQARILGPFYLPLVALGFVVATVLPYWLASPRSRSVIRDVRSYFVRGVYPNTWHEWWAYRADR